MRRILFALLVAMLPASGRAQSSAPDAVALIKQFGRDVGPGEGWYEPGQWLKLNVTVEKEWFEISILDAAYDLCRSSGGEFRRTLSAYSGEPYVRGERRHTGLYSCVIGERVAFDLSHVVLPPMTSSPGVRPVWMVYFKPANGRSEALRKEWQDRLDEPRRRAEQLALKEKQFRATAASGMRACYLSRSVIIVDRKATLAQVQIPGGNLEWVELKDLYPSCW